MCRGNGPPNGSDPYVSLEQRLQPQRLVPTTPTVFNTGAMPATRAKATGFKFYPMQIFHEARIRSDVVWAA